METWPSVHFKETGYTVLRSGTKTVVMKYGPHGGGHGHPDKLSISIHDGEKEIVSDMGTCAYGVPAFTKWYRKTLSHSTLTVDAKDQKSQPANCWHSKHIRTEEKFRQKLRTYILESQWKES